MLLGAAAVFLSAAYGAEAEIHVTTGPDGIEIFSNLPRDPLPARRASVQPVSRGATVFAVAGSVSLPEASGGQERDTESPGKSFLHDD